MFKNKKLVLIFLTCTAITACLIGCVPQSESADADNASDVNSDASTPTASLMDSDCTTCHTVEVASTEDATCLASLPTHASADCLSCHEYNDDLEKAHAKVSPGDTPVSKLKRTEVTDEACSSCHNYADLAQKTSSVTVLTDKNGTTVNPHEIQNTGTGHSDVQCSSCHKMHVEANTDNTAKALCISCHHENLYECGTCH